MVEPLAVMSFAVLQKLCKDTQAAAYAAQTAKQNNGEEERTEQRKKDWRGYEVGTIICDVDGECVRIQDTWMRRAEH
jgi:hypothetical protein